MIYIKQEGGVITLGGQVANKAMLASGWFEYHGEIPEKSLDPHEYFALENDILVIRSNDQQQRAAKFDEMKKYLANTDYKMTVDYFAQLTSEQQDELMSKRSEARKLIREYQDHSNNQTAI